MHAGGGVAQIDLDGLERHVELLGDHLADGNGDAVAHVHLAEEGGDGAVGIDGDVGRELVGRQRRFDSGLCMGLADGEDGVEADRHADRDDERSAALEQGAAGESG